MIDAPPGSKSSPETNLQMQLSVSAVPASPIVAPPPPRGPWLTPVTAPILVALVALIAPVTAAVYAHYEARLELELDRQKQADERTRLYLERAISQDAGAESRVQVLRFLEIQTSDADLRTWAIAELKELREELTELRAAEKQLVEEVEQTQQAVASLSAEQEQIALKIAAAPAQEEPKLRERLDRLNRDLEAKRIAEAEKSVKLSQVATRLHGADAGPGPATARAVCARAAYFNPIHHADIQLPAGEREKRARECDRSLSARVPPPDATVSASGLQWRWQLPSGTTCGCQIGR